MPELPEVETVKRSLADLIVGRKILEIEATYPRMVLTGFNKLKARLEGQTFRKVSRRGKYLIFALDTDLVISHLRMEGKYRLEPLEAVLGKHDHLSVRFRDCQLVYQDVRKFGTWELISPDQLEGYFQKKKLGPEPTKADFNYQTFSQKLQHSAKKIKPYLLEQTLVAGLGNIYADEVLWRAKIHPATASDHLTERSKRMLHEQIIAVLQRAIDLGGSSVRTYQNALGKSGKMQEELQVYGRQGQPCSRCGHEICKIKLSGRGTHFCPICQKLH